jgi:hypothetical protein
VDTGSPSENATTQREKSEARFYQNGIRYRRKSVVAGVLRSMRGVPAVSVPVGRTTGPEVATPVLMIVVAGTAYLSEDVIGASRAPCIDRIAAL